MVLQSSPEESFCKVLVTDSLSRNAKMGDFCSTEHDSQVRMMHVNIELLNCPDFKWKKALY